MVYHSLLTDDLDEALERMQDRALRCIFGTGLSGRRMRMMAGVSTLRERRVKHYDTFASKAAASARFSSWFPLTTGRRSARTNAEKYLELYTRFERLRATPLFFFRRRLNGKVGKNYGERYREYRE